MVLISDDVKTAILLATSGFFFLIIIYPRNKLEYSFFLRSVQGLRVAQWRKHTSSPTWKAVQC